MFATLPGKVRLNRIKHLARSINDPVGDGIPVGGMMKENETSNSKFNHPFQLMID